MSNQLRFVASMTVCPSDIKKIQYHLQLAEGTVNPLQNLLITPLFANSKSLSITRDMAEAGSNVMFDSGGYYVQTGRTTYQELYFPLLNLYKQHPWADIYTLPDYVPLSKDSPETVDAKVQDTVTFSELFFQELPDSLKAKAMPVVQGYTYEQIDTCLDAYIQLGVKWIGFGSFGTVGANNEINVATNTAIELARYVIDVAHSYGIKVHLFGLGTPALVAMLKGIQADSFDSSTWLKSAGFGQVFLPFMRAYNISHQSTVSELQRGVTFEQFQSWKALTGHSCQLCNSLVDLQLNKMYRAAHNLLVMVETVNMVNVGDQHQIREIYRQGSPKYRQEYTKWLQ